MHRDFLEPEAPFSPHRDRHAVARTLRVPCTWHSDTHDADDHDGNGYPVSILGEREP